MKNKYSELKLNTMIIAIANLGSKAISFILAPLYSYYLTTREYGTMDLITTTVGLLVPLVCLDIFEATFRFSSDTSYDKKKVFSSSIAVCFFGIIFLFIVIVVSSILIGNIYLVLFSSTYIFLEALDNVMAQFVRGQNKMVSFALTGVINSIIILIFNIIFLVCLKWNLTGWLISFLLAKFAVTIYLFISSDVIKNFSLHCIDINYIKTFMKFCIPLIPTATMWWIMNVSDRYMITFFIGTAATGIYSVANKLPSILSVFENIFYQAWQTTAINTINDNDRDSFYSAIFNRYMEVLTIGIIAILFIAKPLVIILFAKEYMEAWICMAPLILGVLFHALSGNLGSLYSVFKDTKGAFYSTVIGAAINIILNFLIVPIAGILGAAITTLVGYIVTLVYRWVDIKKFVHLKLDSREFISCTLIVIIQLILYYIPGVESYCIRFIILAIVIIQKRNIIIAVLRR